MSKKSKYDTVLVEKRGSVLWLSFNRPGRMNAFNMDMIDETYAAIEEADADEEVRCILVKGEGDKADCILCETNLIASISDSTLYDRLIAF